MNMKKRYKRRGKIKKIASIYKYFTENEGLVEHVDVLFPLCDRKDKIPTY